MVSGRPLWAALTAAVLAAAGLAFVHLREPQPVAPPEMRTEIVTPATADPMSFALSPDGTQVVYSAVSEGVPGLWLRALRTTTAQLLSGTEDGQEPFWSPDGRSIGFFARGALKRLDLGGGAPETLAETGFIPRGGTWFPDGSIVFASDRVETLLRVSATGGTPTVVPGVDPQFSHRAPHGLPDGRRFLFLALDSGRSKGSGIYLGSLDGTPPRQLVSTTRPGVYLADRAGSTGGWLLWARDGGTLTGQRLDMGQAALIGEPVTVSDGIAGGGDNAGVSVSASGLVAYRMDTGSGLRLTWVDRSGAVLATVGEADATLGSPRAAPDGRRALVHRTAQGNTDVWMVDGARAMRLTFDRASDLPGNWSPDGRRFAFRSTRSGRSDLYLGLVSSPGGEERLVVSDQLKVPNSWSRDGRFLIYGSVDPTDGTDLWVVPMEDGQTPAVFLKTPFTERNADVSPDGRWVAYQSNSSGRDEVYVRPFAFPGPASPLAGQWQISTEGGRHPVWGPDGRELYYVNPAGQLMAVRIAASESVVEPGAPALLFPMPIYPSVFAVSAGRQYDVAPDGRFLILRAEGDTDAPITLLQNWNPEGRR